MVKEEAGKSSLLEQTRLKALRLLDERLEAPHTLGLRRHQMPAILDWRKSLADGKTAGYLDLPTGGGKTVIAAKFAELGLNTIVVSPTGEILDKTKATIERHAPGISVSNYDGRLKDVKGNVINTTLPSLEKLSQIPAIAEGVELIIVDELHHGTLGRQRHELWKRFPNAIFVGLTATPDFSQLDDLESKAKIDGNERWTGMFRNLIHKLPREEAQEYGALVPLDVHIVTTNSVVGDVQITKGDYNQNELDRMLNTEARNMQALALVAGVDSIPPTIKLSEEKRAELQSIHETIQGKKTAIFGLNIDHIEKLAQRLRDEGIKAVAVHGKMPRSKQITILEAYEKGLIQVILGVDLLSIGWDSPTTEVGIFMRPRRSDTAVIQEVGRLLRTSEETGKERAIAIQLVDQYENADERPVLIPEVIDPDYILQGNRKVGQQSRSTSNQADRESTITISGIDIQAVQELVTEREVRKRLAAAGSLTEVNDVLDDIITGVRKETQGDSIIEVYKSIAKMLPGKIDANIIEMVLKGINHTDPQTRDMGKKLFLLLNIKSVLSAVQPYFSENNEANEEILQTALEQVYKRTESIRPENTAAQIRSILQTGDVVQTAAEAASVPNGWVIDRVIGPLTKAITAAIAEKRAVTNSPLNDWEVAELAQQISDELKLDSDVVTDAIKYYDRRTPHGEDASHPDDTGIEIFSAGEVPLEETLESIFEQILNDNQRTVIRARHGIGEENKAPQTLATIGTRIGLTPERIRGIESATFSKLRYPSIKKKLQPYRE